MTSKIFVLKLFVVLCLSVVSVIANGDDERRCETSRYEVKPRVFVLTDMSNEPDDQMSLVRFLTYANELDIQGIAGITSVWKNDSIDDATIRTVLHAYGNVTTNLNANVPKSAPYPSARSLLSKVHLGHPVYGLANLDLPPSDASRALIRAVDAATPDKPQWVLMWGGGSVLAEAMQQVSRTRAPKYVADFVQKLRVYSISDQDDTGPWIRQNYPKMFFVVSLHAFSEYTAASWNGISGEEYRHFDVGGPDSSIVSNDWLQENIRIGDLGAHYLNWSFIMEGDTPSFFPLIQNGLGDSEHPEWGSWGGRFKPLDASRRTKLFTDATDYVKGLNGQFFMSIFATIWRWRQAYQYDFATRMQWTVNGEYDENNHAPIAIVNGTCGPAAMSVNYSFNQSMVIDASESWDPDGDNLKFTWFHYRDVSARLEGKIPEVDDMMSIETLGLDASMVRVTPKKKIAMHLVLVLEDMRDMSLTTYRRIILKPNA